MTTKHPAKTRGFSLVSTSSVGTSVNAHAVGNTIILLSYNTMPGNQPSSYSNTAFIWQGSGAIPYNQNPLSSTPVSGNTQSGSTPFSGLEVQTKDYIIGYAVGPNVSNICSWVSIPAGSGTPTTYQTSVWTTPDGVLPDVVLVYYDTPVGNQPQTNNQWIGIWQGAAPSYTVAPLAQTPVGNNNATGQVALSVTLLRGTTYSLAYFTGQKQTTMASSFLFST
ncbi:hypothetical protein [Bradyrhizobium sp.]|jgi:hypothetical protein|uniref:hypothetical protein n=1 Tax=Bradyrhizobium sp. TaxID=376 RepID=UPI002E0ABB2E|nr:hypothetical protein [Bradyrhizobium sp.]